MSDHGGAAFAGLMFGLVVAIIVAVCFSIWGLFQSGWIFWSSFSVLVTLLVLTLLINFSAKIFN